MAKKPPPPLLDLAIELHRRLVAEMEGDTNHNLKLAALKVEDAVSRLRRWADGKGRELNGEMVA